MKKIKIQKITFISLILVIFIISCIAYTFPNLFPMCFPLSNIAAAFLFSNFLWIYPSLNHNFRTQISPMRFLIACIAVSIILIIYIGIIGYFLWHYPLSSIIEPINCFIITLGVSFFTFSTLTFLSFTFTKIYKKND